MLEECSLGTLLARCRRAAFSTTEKPRELSSNYLVNRSRVTGADHRAVFFKFLGQGNSNDSRKVQKCLERNRWYSKQTGRRSQGHFCRYVSRILGDNSHLLTLVV